MILRVVIFLSLLYLTESLGDLLNNSEPVFINLEKGYITVVEFARSFVSSW